MKKWVLWIGGAVFTMSLLMIGCGGSGKDGETAVAESPGPEETGSGAGFGAGSKESGPEAALGAEALDERTDGAQEQGQEQRGQDLYDTYIQINNLMVGHFDDVIDRYFRRVCFQEGYALLDEEKKCLAVKGELYVQMDRAMELIGQKAKESGAEQPSGAKGQAGTEEQSGVDGQSGLDDLDEAYQTLYPVMRELAEALDQVEAYTRSKAYLEDDYEEGKRLHGIIWKDCREYEVLHLLFLEELDQLAEEVEEEELELLKGKGLAASYSIYAMTRTAQKLRRAIDAQGIDDRRVEELDMEALLPLYEQYLEEAELCLEYLEDEPALSAEGYPAGTPSFDRFKEQAAALKAVLAELFGQEGGQQEADGGHPASAVPAGGLIGRFDQTLSGLIDAHNALFEEQG